jgi:chromosome segregation ATPase
MSTNALNDNFKQKLIDESLTYQILLKRTQVDYKHLQSIYNINIGNLKKTIDDKEEEIDSLQEKIKKILMDIGSYTVRNHILTKEKKQLEDNYNNLQTQIIELDNKYQEQKEIYEKTKEKQLQDIQNFMKIINCYTNENTNLKQQLEKDKEKYNKDLDELIEVISIHNNQNIIVKQELELEKEKFIELQKLLQASYETIYKLSSQDK